MTTTTRIGLAGYGFGGRFFHAPLLAAAPGVRFAGVVTRSPERRAELTHDHPDTPAFDSLADLAAAGANAVAISTPAQTHIPPALEAIGVTWSSNALPCRDRQEYLDNVAWFAAEVIAKMPPERR